MKEVVRGLASDDPYEYQVMDPDLRDGEVVVQVSSLDGRTKAREWIPADSATPEHCAEVAAILWGHANGHSR